MKSTRFWLGLVLLFAVLLPMVSAAPENVTNATYAPQTIHGVYTYYPIGFIFFIGLLIFTLFRMIIRLANLDYNLEDLTYSLIVYISFLFYYYFAQTYFNDAFILNMCNIFLKVGGITHLIIPLIAIIFVWIKQGSELA